MPDDHVSATQATKVQAEDSRAVGPWPFIVMRLPGCRWDFDCIGVFEFRFQSLGIFPLMQPLIFSHDGGVDDYVALALLAAELGGPGGSGRTLLGVVVTGADCFLELALATTSRILSLFSAGGAAVPLVRSTVRGANAFPHEWRSTSVVVAHLPILLRASAAVGTPGTAEAAPATVGPVESVPVASSDAPRWLVDTLLASPVPVDIIETGPLTTIAEALALDPACAAKIGRLCEQPC